MTEIKELVKELSVKHGKERKSLLPIFHGIIEHENFISKEAMLEVARELDISAAEVYGTASFFSFLDTEAKGKYKVRICKSITCDMKGKAAVLATLEEMLKIKTGETTADNMFSLLHTNCIGLCDQGPAMLINDNYYTQLTPEKIRVILGEYIRSKV
ncbi:MAG: NAD(P)H-dependent oxidoreductase subunit E [Bacteroidales bacterium]